MLGLSDGEGCKMPYGAARGTANPLRSCTSSSSKRKMRTGSKEEGGAGEQGAGERRRGREVSQRSKGGGAIVRQGKKQCEGGQGPACNCDIAFLARRGAPHRQQPSVANKNIVVLRMRRTGRGACAQTQSGMIFSPCPTCCCPHGPTCSPWTVAPKQSSSAP